MDSMIAIAQFYHTRVTVPRDGAGGSTGGETAARDGMSVPDAIGDGRRYGLLYRSADRLIIAGACSRPTT
jgi:hypothetical protein